MQRIIEFYENGFYYPNTFLVAILLSSMLLVTIFILAIFFIRRQIPAMKKTLRRLSSYTAYFVKKHRRFRDIVVFRASVLLIVSIMLVGVTHLRIISGYSDGINAPWGNALKLVRATDYYTCVIRRTGKILESEPLVYRQALQSACGYTFPLLFASIFLMSPKSTPASVLPIYMTVIAMGYALFMYILAKHLNPKGRLLLILCSVGFLIGLPAVHGIWAANVDVALALMFGFYILHTLRVQKAKKRISTIHALLLGVAAGAMVNAKMFLLPLTLIPLLLLRIPATSFAGFLISFVGITYAPRLFGSESSLSDFIRVVLFWGNNISIKDLLNINFSIAALSTIGTDCLARQDCHLSMRPFMHRGLEIGTFVLGLWPLKEYLRKQAMSFRNSRLGYAHLVTWVNTLRDNPHVFLLALVTCAAAITLLPGVVYGYRLYFSFVLLVLSYDFARHNRQLLYDWILSVVCLILSGTWLVYAGNRVFWLFDARIVNVFVIGHFIFLMKLHAEGYIFSLKSRRHRV
ncbi:MAG TPA: hypothetical protein VJB96_04525 [Patescibacteria group bacterium]|nr:hypothetical protein [Patescibacteria group bacterium]